MGNEVLTQWSDIVYGIFFVGFLVKVHFAMVRYASRPRSDGEYLAELSGATECSERKMFSLGAEDWHVPEKTLDGDFREYILSGELPYYMKHFVRRHRSDEASQCLRGGFCPVTCPL